MARFLRGPGTAVVTAARSVPGVPYGRPPAVFVFLWGGGGLPKLGLGSFPVVAPPPLAGQGPLDSHPLPVRVSAPSMTRAARRTARSARL